MSLKRRDKIKEPGKSERDAVSHPEFREDLRYWVEVDRKTALRVFNIIEDVIIKGPESRRDG